MEKAWVIIRGGIGQMFIFKEIVCAKNSHQGCIELIIDVRGCSGKLCFTAE